MTSVLHTCCREEESGVTGFKGTAFEAKKTDWQRKGKERKGKRKREDKVQGGLRSRCNKKQVGRRKEREGQK